MADIDTPTLVLIAILGLGPWAYGMLHIFKAFAGELVICLEDAMNGSSRTVTVDLQSGKVVTATGNESIEERLSANAEDFDAIIADLLAEREELQLKLQPPPAARLTPNRPIETSYHDWSDQYIIRMLEQAKVKGRLAHEVSASAIERIKALRILAEGGRDES